MKRAYAVIGANFGDEGKGLMTDYFCRKHNDKVLNIRYNGGAQAGHTVVTADGKRHVFSHIGAGTFSVADTYLSEFFTINPMLFMKEYESLYNQYGLSPKVIVSKNAPVTLPCDILINQFAEKSRGNKRHGSCGMGINETVIRSKNDKFRVRFGDISFLEYPRNISRVISEMAAAIRNINKLYVPHRLEELGITNPPDEFYELLNNENIIYNYIDDFMNMYRICRNFYNDDSIINEYDTIVFEGAQGLLLDRDRNDYFPNLTPSNTGMKNIRSILDKFPDTDTEVCYVTRSYFTRHGAGKFISEYQELAEKYQLSDKTNHTNEYQGYFRYGYFDTAEFMKSIEFDRTYLKDSYKTSLCVTHLDETDGKILCRNENISADDLQAITGMGKLYKSYSEIADNIE
ncbi:MAG: adenylosuccinate synthetase [Oscillospiraceae bacterium]